MRSHASKARLILVFLLAFACAAGALKLFLDHQFRRQLKFLRTEGSLLRTLVVDRLHLHERGAQAMGRMAEQLLQHGDAPPPLFAALADIAVQSLHEVVGVNMLDAQGRIVQVHPYQENQAALGRVSQNISSLREATAQGQRVWLSPPFLLFQGMPGSAYYVAVQRQGKLIGWLGVPIDQGKFFEAFPLDGDTGNFHLRVEDMDARTVHFSTTDKEPGASPGLAHRRFKVMGRPLRVSTWPREPGLLAPQTGLLLVLALTAAVLATAAWNFFEQRRLALRKLDDLNQLLRLTLHDTANSLAVVQAYLDLQRDNPQLIAPEQITPHVSYVVDLLQQIKLVHHLSNRSPVWRQERQPLLPLFLEMAEIFADRLEEKRLTLDYDPEGMSHHSPSLNGGLFAHSVLGNLLRTAIKSSPVGGTIRAGLERQGDSLELSFRHAGAPPVDDAQDFGFLIARKVVELHGGSLERGRAPEGGTMVKVRLPA